MSCERACVTAQCGARCGSAEKCAASEQSSSFNAERARRGECYKKAMHFSHALLYSWLLAQAGPPLLAIFLMMPPLACARASACTCSAPATASRSAQAINADGARR
jgi:hypothetical protein